MLSLDCVLGQSAQQIFNLVGAVTSLADGPSLEFETIHQLLMTLIEHTY